MVVPEQKGDVFTKELYWWKDKALNAEIFDAFNCKWAEPETREINMHKIVI